MTSLIGFLILISNSASAMEIKVIAGQVTYEILQRHEKALKEKAGISLKFVSEPAKVNSKTNFQKVQAGEADVGVSPTSWTDWQKVMRENGMSSADISKFAYRLVGNDILYIVANPKVGIKKLTKKDLARIFAGEVKNWKEFGSVDLPVQLVIRSNFQGTTGFFKRTVMENKEMSKIALDAIDAENVIEMVRDNPGAISYVSQIKKLEGVDRIELDSVLGRPVLALTLGRPKPEVEKLLQFLSGQLGN